MGLPNSDPFDDSLSAAVQDTATVTSDGKPLDRRIDGVRTSAPVVHVDHRGRVFEVYPGPSDFWTDPVVYCYAFSVRPRQTKGWGLHQEKDDRYTLMKGEVLTLLYDPRVGSPTQGLVQKVVLTEQGIRSLRIPIGVWHMSINLADEEALLVNHPTQPYRHDRPDRLLLPWNTPHIPVDVAALFPNQLHGPIACPCE